MIQSELASVFFDPAKMIAFPKPEYVKGKIILNIMQIYLTYAKSLRA